MVSATQLVLAALGAALSKLAGVKTLGCLLEVGYEDGQQESIVVDTEGIVTAMVASSKPTAKQAADPKAAAPAPEAIPMKRKGDTGDKAKGKKPFRGQQTEVLIGLCQTHGTASYLTNKGEWMRVAILEKGTDTWKVCGVKEGMAKVSFAWVVRDAKKLKDDRAIGPAECKCEKCRKARQRKAA